MIAGFVSTKPTTATAKQKMLRSYHWGAVLIIVKKQIQEKSSDSSGGYYGSTLFQGAARSSKALRISAPKPPPVLSDS